MKKTLMMTSNINEPLALEDIFNLTGKEIVVASVAMGALIYGMWTLGLNQNEKNTVVALTIKPDARACPVKRYEGFGIIAENHGVTMNPSRENLQSRDRVSVPICGNGN